MVFLDCAFLSPTSSSEKKKRVGGTDSGLISCKWILSFASLIKGLGSGKFSIPYILYIMLY